VAAAGGAPRLDGTPATVEPLSPVLWGGGRNGLGAAATVFAGAAPGEILREKVGRLVSCDRRVLRLRSGSPGYSQVRRMYTDGARVCFFKCQFGRK
jgi:hypothetical protein